MKLIYKISTVFTVICTSLLLSGCDLYSYKVNAPQTESFLNRTLHLQHTMVLVQTRDWRSWGENYYYLIPAPAATSKWHGRYSDVIFQDIPSVKDFENTKSQWQSWQGKVLFNQSRIVGIVASETAFHISKIVSASYQPYSVEVTLDSGNYKGIEATSVQPETLVPLKLLRN